MVPKFEREGFWWARWIRADPGTADDGEAASHSNHFEPVEVFANCTDDPGSKEPWRVAVIGVEKSQSVENFEWGEPVAPRKSV